MDARDANIVLALAWTGEDFLFCAMGFGAGGSVGPEQDFGSGVAAKAEAARSWASVVLINRIGCSGILSLLKDEDCCLCRTRYSLEKDG